MNKCKYVFSLIMICLIFNSDFGKINNERKKGIIDHQLQADDCPVINTTAISVKASDCGEANGSVTGITATGVSGKLFYTWTNSSNAVVSHDLNLLDVPSDQYTLEVQDGGICGKAFTNPIAVGENNGITIDITNLKNTPSSCKIDGSVTGIAVTGATQIEWKVFGTDSVVSTTADLTNMPPGSYKLFASNSYCSQEAGPFIIASATEVPAIQKVSLVNPTCNQSNGSIGVTLLVSQTQPKLNFYWEDSTGAVIANGIILAGELNPVITINSLAGGDFYLFVEGSNNCFIQLGKYTLLFPVISIVLDSAFLVPDRCNEHVGYMQVKVIGGTPPPPISSYIWTDSTGTVISKDKGAGNLGAGTYTLTYTDVAGCTATASFTLTNNSPSVPVPAADGTTLCLPGMAGIAAKNADTAGTYRLYASVTDSIPIASNKTGVFYQNVKQTTDFYLAKSNGACESQRTKVTITVVADINIPNTFTPNNDGINDLWNIKGIDKFPGAVIDVFNRDGQLVFHSVNYSKPFDGLYNGKQLPTGVYYYVIDVKQPICFGKIAGSLTIIR